MTLYTERPSAIRVLVEARALLAERGWVAESPHEGDWFGEQEGPLTMRTALWAVARWEKDGKTLVDPGAAGRAVKALCTVLYRRDDPGSYVELGRWGRVPGRTQEEVLALFARTIEGMRRGAQAFAAKLEAALADDGACGRGPNILHFASGADEVADLSPVEVDEDLRLEGIDPEGLQATLRQALGKHHEGAFWVAELTDPVTGNTLGGIYWNGHTRPLFEPVTTTDIHEALKWRDAESCQAQIDRCGQLKRGVLRPVEHLWMREGR